jgi:hypothetical protein
MKWDNDTPKNQEKQGFATADGQYRTKIKY